MPFANNAELGLAANGSRDLPESLVKRPRTQTIILIAGALSACSSSMEDNPLWGAPRIHGELLKLGFEVAQSSVAKYGQAMRPAVPAMAHLPA